MRDEAEIRVISCCTYIGPMPGKLFQKMAKVGVKNPLFLLDEIDKMSSEICEGDRPLHCLKCWIQSRT
ncbi:hypothetical protein ACLK1T_04865 [Escherichia coli]